MGVKHERFRGVHTDNIHIPEDVEMTWNSKGALYTSTQIPALSTLSNKPDKPDSEGITAEIPDIRVIMTGLYGRRGANRLAELGCTLSHLLAIRHAVYSNLDTVDILDNSNSQIKLKQKYAIITEDDILFPFDVNYSKLASTAPDGWAILQVCLSLRFEGLISLCCRCLVSY